MARLRASQREEQREAVRQTAQLAMRNRRTNRTDQQRDNLRRARRNASSVDFNRVAFQYDCTIDYSSHPLVRIGPMEIVCNHCGALKFAGEMPGLCCLSGKVKLPLLPPPPEPLHSLLRGETPESRHFLSNTRRYKACFQMTSFGADIIEERGFNPTFKVISTRESKRSSSFGDHNLVILTSPSTLQIQDQIHDRIGSLQPLEDAQHKFIQIYFMGNMEEQLDQRQTINTAMKRAILQDLQQLLHEHHALVRLFKTVLDRMPSDDYKVVIRADK
jgi:hypothetical protein